MNFGILVNLVLLVLSLWTQDENRGKKHKKLETKKNAMKKQPPKQERKKERKKAEEAI